ncbi:hypothetical protein MKK55_28745 [Methylobacterium sp. J-059]|uniref:hypothetical protein n=1 Tax=Methylobacterium sp. J-059 TaxID=2836643 RepID=UPI001FB93E59|nr:hypothetical protein [Methylobacterium sp. J-059]MCJ2042905.1 hypothetical protein [Methylobacterium sp. J-059]
MSNVLTFAPRPKMVAPVEPAPMGEAEIRTCLGEALQTALDAADHIIAVLDRMEGEIKAENSADAAPACVAPESRVVWLRKNDSVREAEAPETAATDVAAAHAGPSWGARGNIVSDTSGAPLDMVAGGGR